MNLVLLTFHNRTAASLPDFPNYEMGRGSQSKNVRVNCTSKKIVTLVVLTLTALVKATIINISATAYLLRKMDRIEVTQVTEGILEITTTLHPEIHTDSDTVSENSR